MKTVKDEDIQPFIYLTTKPNPWEFSFENENYFFSIGWNYNGKAYLALVSKQTAYCKQLTQNFIKFSNYKLMWNKLRLSWLTL